MKTIAAMALLVAGMGATGNAPALLLDRGPDIVYDDVLDITWTRMAGDGVARNWADAVAWADALEFGGFSDWRLPWASVTAGAGPTGAVYSCTGDGSVTDENACRDNEMGYMFYYNLDGNLSDDKTGTQTAVGGEALTGIQPDYWSGTELFPSYAWLLLFGLGFQGFDGEDVQRAAWAVRPGDVAAANVPVPATLALLGLGLAGLGFSSRRKAVQA